MCRSRLKSGDDLIASNEQVIASVGVSRGRVYLVSTKAIYCIGKRSPATAQPRYRRTLVEKAPANAAVAYVQVVPVDLVMKPGDTAKFRARLFDDHGRFIREEPNATWSFEGLKGDLHQQQFTAGEGTQAGTVKATRGPGSRMAHVRVIPPTSV